VAKVAGHVVQHALHHVRGMHQYHRMHCEQSRALNAGLLPAPLTNVLLHACSSQITFAPVVYAGPPPPDQQLKTPLSMMTKGMLTTLGLVTCTLLANAQVSLYVTEPPTLFEKLDYEPAVEWGSFPDMTNPANAISAQAALVNDGTAADSLACQSLVNPAAIAGKIAVTYRGSCEFSLKALNAQQAGALAVIIINTAPGNPITMGVGANGGLITIPVLMINDTEGAKLRSLMESGNVNLWLGNTLGTVANNIRLDRFYIVPPRASALPMPLANAASGFSLPIGCNIQNHGTASQTNVVAQVIITRDGVEVYNQSSIPTNLDTDLNSDVFITLPPFAPAGFDGLYEVTYTATSDQVDAYPWDNTVRSTFLATELYGNALVDPASELTQPNRHYRPASPNSEFTSCVVFREPNASAVRVNGIHASAARLGAQGMTGETLQIKAIQWSDSFQDMNGATFDALETIATATYTYGNSGQGQMVYIPFDAPITLMDDQRYLFCVSTSNLNVHFGYDTRRNYQWVMQNYPQPLYAYNVSDPSSPNNIWQLNEQFGISEAPAIGVRMTPLSVGLDDRAGESRPPYPNPASQMIHIPSHGHHANTWLEVFDLSGQKVAEQRPTMDGNGYLMVDVRNIANGTYLFRLDSDDMEAKSFRVVVTH
jgi:hypothetical protein